ncbi:MAG TPA: sensor histidine kinase, partial [Candidatus Pelethocola excrementipullorum]|nr:sensor histidine kinase [Candidatus Pelethocola excrementipullorum]
FSKLFTPFYRTDQSRNRKTGGSGLGLYIVQKILNQHQSNCHVRNTKLGVEFSFTI